MTIEKIVGWSHVMPCHVMSVKPIHFSYLCVSKISHCHANFAVSWYLYYDSVVLSSYLTIIIDRNRTFDAVAVGQVSMPKHVVEKIDNFDNSGLHSVHLGKTTMFFRHNGVCTMYMMQHFLSPSCTNSIVTRNHHCNFPDGRILKRKTALDSELS